MQKLVIALLLFATSTVGKDVLSVTTIEGVKYVDCKVSAFERDSLFFHSNSQNFVLSIHHIDKVQVNSPLISWGFIVGGTVIGFLLAPDGTSETNNPAEKIMEWIFAYDKRMMVLSTIAGAGVGSLVGMTLAQRTIWISQMKPNEKRVFLKGLVSVHQKVYDQGRPPHQDKADIPGFNS